MNPTKEEIEAIFKKWEELAKQQEVTTAKKNTTTTTPTANNRGIQEKAVEEQLYEWNQGNRPKKKKKQENFEIWGKPSLSKFR